MSEDFTEKLQKSIDELDADLAIELLDAKITETRELLEKFEGLREKIATCFGRK